MNCFRRLSDFALLNCASRCTLLLQCSSGQLLGTIDVFANVAWVGRNKSGRTHVGRPAEVARSFKCFR